MAKATGSAGAPRGTYGMGSVTELRPGVWRAQYRVPGRPRQNVPGTYPSKRAAGAALKTFIAKAATQGVPVANVEVGAYLERWLAAQARDVGRPEDKELSPNTWANYRWALRPVIDKLGTRRLDQLTVTEVRDLLYDLAEAGHARNSVIRVRSVLGKALADAMAEPEYGLHRNVARLAALPKKVPAPKNGRMGSRAMRTLTEAQAVALLTAAQDTPVEAFLVVGLSLALRPGELLGLRWADVDFKAGYVTLSGALKREPGGVRLGGTKNAGAARALAMTPSVVAALHKARDQQAFARRRAGVAWEDNDLVFANEFGRPLLPSNMDRKLAKVVAAAGLPGRWSMNELARHSGLSLQAAHGMTAEQLAYMAGHVNTRMVTKHYVHQLRPNNVHLDVAELLAPAGASADQEAK
jgi:integrase